ncbi:hypothetical protein [Ornithinibacillus sp. 179-J 7C1 HS]|uniref:hypothetical protein n=1 Tax=Ornithinibacillus sp. 179-J 7C1 HS TaxID=3142384 RepID=UPI0039A0126A
MMRYLKLTNFELSRFFKIYVVLIGITLGMQLLGVVLTANHYVGEINEMVASGNSIDEAIRNWGMFAFDAVTRTFWFGAPIALCMVTLLIYTLFIWYRDWFGKNTFIYRLLMLPTARINVFFAKASAIFLMVLGLISLQLIFLVLEMAIMKSIVPSSLRVDLTLSQVIYSFDSWRVLYPVSIIEFIINYGIGFMAVIVLFTGVLFERSFRWKGILLGLLFAGISLLVFVSPLLVQTFLVNNFFYPIEMFMFMVISGLVVTGGAIWMSNYLLNKKIRV